jgi:hypothetical protein
MWWSPRRTRGSHGSALEFFILPIMKSDPDVLRLQMEFAAATAECTAAMNEQFLALMAGDVNLERFNARIATAHEMRQRAMDSLLNHIRAHGWS